MRISALVFVAVLLGLLLGGVVYVALDRLGYLEPWEAPDWELENQLLKVPLGSWVILRSANPEAGAERLWFGPKIADPAVPELPPGPTDMPPVPHVRIGRTTRLPGEKTWLRAGGAADVSFATFAQMGARTPGEYLQEIRPVRELRPDGSRHLMLRAAFGTPTGAKVVYFFDPSEPQPELRGFGWTRMEAYAKEQAEIVFTFPDGRTVPESVPEDR